MNGKQTFETVRIKHDKMEATSIEMPFDVEAVFGAKPVPVKAEIIGIDYHGSIVRMGGKYMLGVPKAFREVAATGAGDHIVVTVAKDIAERIVDVPSD